MSERTNNQWEMICQSIDWLPITTTATIHSRDSTSPPYAALAQYHWMTVWLMVDINKADMTPTIMRLWEGVPWNVVTNRRQLMSAQISDVYKKWNRAEKGHTHNKYVLLLRILRCRFLFVFQASNYDWLTQAHTRQELKHDCWVQISANKRFLQRNRKQAFRTRGHDEIERKEFVKNLGSSI